MNGAEVNDNAPSAIN